MNVVETPSSRPLGDAIGVASSVSVATDGSVAVSAGARERNTARAGKPRVPLYTPEERVRRDQSAWTNVQGLLAPLQLLVMLASVVLVVRYLRTGDGLNAANLSVILKTLFLYVIMITGAIWEKEVFGQYLFHAKFFWEDVVSMVVIALHTAYLYGLSANWDPTTNMWIALSAYACYSVNAAQFLLKLRAARLADADLAQGQHA